MVRLEHTSPGRRSARRCLVGGFALAAMIGPPGSSTIFATEDDESCSVTLEVQSCSGKAIAEVAVEVEVEGEESRLKAVTDGEGKAIFEVCADDVVGEVLVYLIEGGAPMSASPSFEKDPFSPHKATARIRLC